jgi:hypothetical protein
MAAIEKLRLSIRMFAHSLAQTPCRVLVFAARMLVNRANVTHNRFVERDHDARLRNGRPPGLV